MPITKLKHSWSNKSSNEEKVKVEFPVLPKEWQDKFVKGQMYKHQDSLPKLPVPPLQQTMKKYLAAVKVRTWYCILVIGTVHGSEEQLL